VSEARELLDEAGGDNMAAYFVVFRDSMSDPGRYAAYLQAAIPTLEGRVARVLALNGALTPVEGECPDGVVIVEFPDAQAAKDFYESPAYQAVVGERLASTQGRAVIVEGLPG
jgi:uncharacterized protein (DUF1330 family)